MRRWRRAIGVVSLATSLGVAACTAVLGFPERFLDSSPGPDGSVDADTARSDGEAGAVADAPGADAGRETEGGADAAPDVPSYRCPDGSGVSDCRACSGGAFSLCQTRCVTDCLTGCDAGPIACVSCADGGFSVICSADKAPAATCPASGCGCAGGVAQCPLDNMVCVTGACLTCGDTDTRGLVCRNGTGMKKCKDISDRPEDRYLCK
jgi:hypothetical protein